MLRARREFQNQSSLGFMTTATNRQLDADTSFLADNAYTGGVDYDWRLSQMLQRHRLSRRQPHATATPSAITRLQENTVHSFQRPDADYLELDPNATSLDGHAGSVSFGKIAGESTRFNIVRRLQDARLRYQRPRLHAPRRRARPVELVPVARLQAGQVRPQRNFNINQYAGWNFGGDRTYSGGNINSHWTFTNYYSIGGGFNLDAAPFRDRVTRGGPGVLGNPGKTRLVLRQHRQSQGAVVLLQRQSLGATPRAACGTTSIPA